MSKVLEINLDSFVTNPFEKQHMIADDIDEAIELSDNNQNTLILYPNNTKILI
jgi:hypothetical protein